MKLEFRKCREERRIPDIEMHCSSVRNDVWFLSSFCNYSMNSISWFYLLSQKRYSNICMNYCILDQESKEIEIRGKYSTTRLSIGEERKIGDDVKYQRVDSFPR